MLTTKTARGASLLLVTSLVGRGMAMAAQLVTGLLLGAADFGIYASAVGIVGFAGLLRGGNAQSYLITLPPTNRRFRTGTVFWVSMGLYLVGLGPLIVAAPWVASWFDAPVLAPLIWIIAATTLGAPLRFILRARLNTRLRFGANAFATFLNDATTYPLTILLAWWLRSPIALALPVLIGSIVEAAYLARTCGPHPTDFAPRRRFVRPVLHHMRWLIAVAAMTSLWTSGDYFVAELLVPVTVLGTYYFGYQLAVQPGRLFNNTIMNVLVPVVRRVKHDRDRLRSAIRRLLGVGGFGIAVVNLSLLAGFSAAERLVWNGAWTDAEFAVQSLSIGLVFTSMFGIATSPFMAERRYRETLVCNLVRALGVVGGALIGSLVGGTVESISTWVTISMITTSLAGIWWTVDRYGGHGLGAIAHFVRCTAPVIVAGFLGAFVGDLVLDQLGPGRLAAIPAGLAAMAAYAIGLVVGLPAIPVEVREEFFRLTIAPLRRRLQRRDETQSS